MATKRSDGGAHRSSAESEAPQAVAQRAGRPRSRERWHERQTEVIDIAAALFASQGFHATSVQDLVDATGLQRGGLYYYMDGKADLLIQIHERFIAPLLAEAREIAAEDAAADVVLRKLARALMDDIATYRDQVTVFLHEWRIIQDHPDWSEIRSARREFEGVIEAVLRRGVDQNLFQIDDLRLAVLGFLGMFNYSYQWYQPTGRTSAEFVADRFCDIFLTGIGVRAPS